MTKKSNINLMSTGMAAILATFFVFSSYGTADARHKYRHRGAVIGGFVAGAIVGSAIAKGSRARVHRGSRARVHRERHCHRNRRGRIYKCHRHKHYRRHHG